MECDLFSPNHSCTLHHYVVLCACLRQAVVGLVYRFHPNYVRMKSIDQLKRQTKNLRPEGRKFFVPTHLWCVGPFEENKIFSFTPLQGVKENILFSHESKDDRHHQRWCFTP